MDNTGDTRGTEQKRVTRRAAKNQVDAESGNMGMEQGEHAALCGRSHAKKAICGDKSKAEMKVA